MWSIRTLRKISLMAAALVVGCGGQDSRFKSPEAVGEALIGAARAGDAAGIERLFPTPALAAGALDCKPPAGPSETSAAVVARLVKRLPELQAADPTWVGLDPRRSRRQELQPGETALGCVAKVPLTVLTTRFMFEVRDSGEALVERERATLLHLGEAGWFLLRI